MQHVALSDVKIPYDTNGLIWLHRWASANTASIVREGQDIDSEKNVTVCSQ